MLKGNESRDCFAQIQTSQDFESKPVLLEIDKCNISIVLEAG